MVFLFKKLSKDSPTVRTTSAVSDRSSVLSTVKFFDQFPYLPSYRYNAYKTYFGAVCTFFMTFFFFVRVVSTTIDFVSLPPLVTESRLSFPKDPETGYDPPELGLLFKKMGFLPFNDPTYFRIQWEQGTIASAGNVTYVDLGAKPCNFIDEDGRLIAEDARCPQETGLLQGCQQDSIFVFMMARIIRCNNGTDVEGKALPGVCKTPAQIDQLIFDGTVEVIIGQRDLKSTHLEEFMKFETFRRELIKDVHLSLDIYLTLRDVHRRARFVIEAYFESFISRLSYVLFDSMQEAFTDFLPAKQQYVGVYFQLSQEYVMQSRRYTGLFDLLEAWGAFGAFLYIFFGLTALQWNANHFHKQIKGLDLRKLDKSQFTKFGRLIDKSFQFPKELADLRAE